MKLTNFTVLIQVYFLVVYFCSADESQYDGRWCEIKGKRVNVRNVSKELDVPEGIIQELEKDNLGMLDILYVGFSQIYAIRVLDFVKDEIDLHLRKKQEILRPFKFFGHDFGTKTSFDDHSLNLLFFSSSLKHASLIFKIQLALNRKHQLKLKVIHYASQLNAFTLFSKCIDQTRS